MAPAACVDAHPPGGPYLQWSLVPGGPGPQWRGGAGRGRARAAQPGDTAGGTRRMLCPSGSALGAHPMERIAGGTYVWDEGGAAASPPSAARLL